VIKAICTCCKEVYAKSKDDRAAVVKFFTDQLVKLTRAVIHYEANRNEQLSGSATSSPQLQYIVFRELVQYCTMLLPSEILYGQQELISLLTDFSLKNEDLFLHFINCGSSYHPLAFLVSIQVVLSTRINTCFFVAILLYYNTKDKYIYNE